VFMSGANLMYSLPSNPALSCSTVRAKAAASSADTWSRDREGLTVSRAWAPCESLCLKNSRMWTFSDSCSGKAMS
jgi:hypothetical protein